MSKQRLVPLNVYAAASAPTGSRAGDLYYNTGDSKLYVYNGSTWIVSSGSGSGGGVTASDTAPTDPQPGQGWFDTSSGLLYIYYDGYWIEPSSGGPQGPPGVVAATSPITYNSSTQTVGIDQTAITIAQSQVTGLSTALSGKASTGDLAAHEADTTNIHGIADTSLLATKSYADNAASTAAAAVVNSAPSTLDTLNELAAALGNDPNYATSTATALGNRVRVDAAQTFTNTEKTQARSNIDAVSTSDSRLSDTRTPTDGSVTTAKIADGAVTNAKLANSSITINGSAVSLGGSATIPAGAKGGGTDAIFWENDLTVNTNYTISTNKNAGTFGPVTVASGVTVTVPSGSTWTVV